VPFYKLFQTLATRRITQAEFDQYMDWYLGLNMLSPPGPGQCSDNLITRRLWAGLWLPLGIERREEETKI